MLALPHPGHVGLALLAVGLLIGAAVASLAWRRIGPTLPREHGGRVVTVVVALTFASVAAAAPYVAWRIVEDTRSNSRLTRIEADEVGGQIAHVDPQAIAELGRLIPPHDSFAAVAPSSVDDSTYTAFWEWAAYALLPRVRVADVGDAGWILSWGEDPRRLGVHVAAVHRLVTDGGPAPHTYYLARVAR
jgi:hypothetical protein